MTDTREHLSFEILNDYVDERLDARAIRTVDEHVRTCAECASELADLRDLLAGVASLPRSVLPPEDIWGDLRASIDRGKNVVLPVGGLALAPETPVLPVGRSSWFTRSALGAAAVVLIALSSGITAMLLRPESPAADVVQNPGKTVIDQPGAPAVLPASFRATEGEYARTIEELRLALAAQRNRLNPETIRTVDHSLAVIDSAIAEARAALLSDPGNRTLVDLLSASYQRKLDLLRRTSELTSRI
jgi:hypothetical protein